MSQRCAADIHEELLLASDKLQSQVEDYVELVRSLPRPGARAEALARLEAAVAQNRALLTAYEGQLVVEEKEGDEASVHGQGLPNDGWSA